MWIHFISQDSIATHEFPAVSGESIAIGCSHEQVSVYSVYSKNELTTTLSMPVGEE